MKTMIHPLLLTLLLVACGGHEAAGQKTGGGMPPAEVSVVTVSTGSATLTRDLPGRLEAYRTAQVRARIDGIVEKRLFTEGSDVKAGSTLFHVDARSYQATFEATKADAALAKQTVERYKPLLEAKAVSLQDYEQAEARWKQAEAALARARIDFENTRVPAPISGRIGRAMVTEGALIGHGEATLLATIEQVDPIYVNFTQPGADVLRLRKSISSGKLKGAESTRVELVLEDGTVYPIAGKLLFSDLAVDAGTGSISLRAEFSNPKHELLPGMFVLARFSEANADGVIKVPQRAVMTGPQGQFVMTVGEGDKVAPRPVSTGGMAGADFIISSGLKGGERVIVDGLQKAKPESVVKPVPLEQVAAAPAAASAVAAKK